MQLRTAPRVAIPTLITGLIIVLLLGGFFVDSSTSQAAPGDEPVYYLLTDHLGSVDVVLDEAGNVVERRDYLPYGSERLSDSAPNSTQTAHKFTGKELDDETDLYYYGARYYDPLIGRFVSADPWSGDLNNPQTLNKYSYVLNNPLRYVDPTGMYGKDVHYDLTLYLGKMAGLTSRQSETVAYRNQYMDDNPDTAPFLKAHLLKSYENLKSGVTAYYHFATREEAEERL